ncbi:hypothetical protein H0H92_004006 [Tricholoma furcatifolium]|nr:hypothetical protein H0H92_004006 [Tricholoma furcatifolium]
MPAYSKPVTDTAGTAGYKTGTVSVRSKPTSSAEPKSKQTKEMTSVTRLEADIAAEAAGAPKKKQRTSRILETTGISVAPPERVRDPGATIPPRPVRHADIALKEADEKPEKESDSDNESEDDQNEKSEHDSADEESADEDQEDKDKFKGDSKVRSNSEAESINSGSAETSESAVTAESDNKDDIEMADASIVTPRKAVEDNDPTPRQEGLKRGRAMSALSPEAVKKISRTAHYSSASAARSASVSSSDVASANNPIAALSVGESESDSDMDLQGSSRTVGGFSRGHASGNVLNIGDMTLDSEIVLKPAPVQGKAILYQTANKEKSTAIAINTSINN